MQGVDERPVQPVQPGLALESDLQATRTDLITERQATLPIVGEQRIAEHDERPLLHARQAFELVDDIPRAARSVRGEDSVRAIGAELGAASTGQQRIGATRPALRNGQRPGVRCAAAHDVPSRKRERVEFGDCWTLNPSLESCATRQRHYRRLRLSHDHEVSVRIEQLRQLRGREPDESDSQPAPPLGVGPFRLVPVIHQGRQHEGDVSVDRRARRVDDLMPRSRAERGDIAKLHAGQIQQVSFQRTDDARDTRERPQARPVSSDDRVLADEAVGRSQIGENDAHECSSFARAHSSRAQVNRAAPASACTDSARDHPQVTHHQRPKDVNDQEKRSGGGGPRGERRL